MNDNGKIACKRNSYGYKLAYSVKRIVALAHKKQAKYKANTLQDPGVR